MLPSFYAPGEPRRTWSIPRTATYGAGVGVIAALFKTFGPLREAGSTSTRIFEIAGAALAFALLCGGAAFLRNVIAQRLIWPRTK